MPVFLRTFFFAFPRLTYASSRSRAVCLALENDNVPTLSRRTLLKPYMLPQTLADRRSVHCHFPSSPVLHYGQSYKAKRRFPYPYVCLTPVRRVYNTAYLVYDMLSNIVPLCVSCVSSDHAEPLCTDREQAWTSTMSYMRICS